MYEAVLRVRPDHFFLRRMPPVSAAAGWLGEPLAAGRVLIWDDQVAVARREDAAAMLLSPALVYASCADEGQWARAVRAGLRGAAARHGAFNVSASGWTMAKCRAIAEMPCSAMALVVIFGALTTWRELPLVSRSWPPTPVQPRGGGGSSHGRGGGGPPPEDFCLKREAFTNETADWRSRLGELGLAC